MSYYRPTNERAQAEAEVRYLAEVIRQRQAQLEKLLAHYAVALSRLAELGGTIEPTHEAS